MSNAMANVPDTVAPSDSRSATVLIAVDDDELLSTHVAETARLLFGEHAHYFIIDVGEPARTQMNWGYVYPVLATAIYEPKKLRGRGPAVLSSEDLAERDAASVADAASLPNATALGDIGDPATAILAAAAEHRANVIVVGSHDSGWFHRLFSSSVREDILTQSPRPVLVIK